MMAGVAGNEVFGADPHHPSRVTAALRALATRHGVQLARVGARDQVAVTVGAMLWCAVTGVSRFSELSLVGPTELEALSRLAMRAAGRPLWRVVEQVGRSDVPTEVLVAVERGVEVTGAAGVDPDDVAARVEADLVGPSLPLSAAAWAFRAVVNRGG